MRGGVGIGAILALCMSWSFNHSVIWAIAHALLGWFYVIYAVIFKAF